MALQRRFAKWLAAGWMAAAVLLLFATVAAAHTTTVVQSDPADGATVVSSPAQVTAQFSEELDTKKSVMQVFDAAGRQVSEGNGKVDLNDPDHKTMFATLPAALPAGAYTVKWHVYLTDGDDSSGQFGFTVAAAAAGSQATAAPSATAEPSASPAATATTAATPTAAATAESTAEAAPTALSASTAATSQSLAPQSLPATGAAVHAVAWQLPVAVALAVLTGAVIVGARRRAR